MARRDVRRKCFPDLTWFLIQARWWGDQFV
jgi:hypothetical protein